MTVQDTIQIGNDVIYCNNNTIKKQDTMNTPPGNEIDKLKEENEELMIEINDLRVKLANSNLTLVELREGVNVFINFVDNL